MDDSVKQGETYQLPVTIDDDSALTATLNVWDDNSTIITVTDNFVDGEVTLDAGIITQPTGDYSYSVTIEYSDGTIDILPDSKECDEEECEFPTLTICPGTPEDS